MKKVLIVSSSLRAGSNSEILAEECLKGALAAGNKAELISLKGKNIKFCIGCLSCQKTGKCVIQDDVPEIMEKVKNADVLVFATPIYYYEMSGQLKTLLDRLNPLYSSDYKFREVYMIATAAEDGDATFDYAYGGLTGWADCFMKAKLKGIVTGGGLEDAKEAIADKAALKQAYELGKNL